LRAEYFANPKAEKARLIYGADFSRLHYWRPQTQSRIQIRIDLRRSTYEDARLNSARRVGSQDATLSVQFATVLLIVTLCATIFAWQRAVWMKVRIENREREEIETYQTEHPW